MSGKMHKYNEKKVKQPGKDYKVGEPVPGTGFSSYMRPKKVSTYLAMSLLSLFNSRNDC